MTRHRARIYIAAMLTALGSGVVAAAIPAGATGPYSTKPAAVHADASPAPVLTNIRVGRHSTFDRVVFDLKGTASGYDVRYVRVVRADPSDRKVNLHGKYFLRVRLTPANAHDVKTGKSTYTGPRKFWVGYPQLREVAMAGDFEANVSIGLGLAHRNGFHVSVMQNPLRVVVDLQH